MNGEWNLSTHFSCAPKLSWVKKTVLVRPRGRWQVKTRRPQGALREAMLARHAGDIVSIDDVADGKQTSAVVDGPRDLRGPGGMG